MLNHKKTYFPDKFPSGCYFDISSFRAHIANTLINPWIGLSKSGHKCAPKSLHLLEDEDFECRRRDWRWEDDTQYMYLSWHKWGKRSPIVWDLCAGLWAYDGSWFGAKCSEIRPYICEKGMSFIFI